MARYPVKSLCGEQLSAAGFEDRGVVGDRCWATYTADGGIGSGKTTRRFRQVLGLLDRPLQLRPEETVAHHDESPVHVVTTAAIRELERFVGERVDAARFRANLVLDVDRTRPVLAGEVIAVSVCEEIAATLRSLMLLDPDCERVVFQAHAVQDGLLLAGTEEQLEELAGFVAAEANHETNPRRQKRLDAAFSLLSDALPGGAF